MAKPVSPWTMEVKHKLIEHNLTVTELADKIGMNRVYVSAVVNERVISEPARKKINDALGIEAEPENSQI